MSFKFLFVDFEGFGSNKNFSVRELSLVHYRYQKLKNKSFFCSPPSRVDCESFKQIKSWQTLTEDEKRQHRYVSKSIHGLTYEPLFECPLSNQAESLIRFASLDVDAILCKGLQKQHFLEEFIQKPILNIEQFGCAKFDYCAETEKYFQTNFCCEPAHQFGRRNLHILSHCAGRKATYFADWICMNNKNADIVEHLSKMSINGNQSQNNTNI